MNVIELRSQRLAKEKNSGRTDVYQYDIIPSNVLFQITLILSNVIGKYWKANSYAFDEAPNNNSAWEFIINTIIRERGDPSFKQTQDSKINCLKILTFDRTLEDQLDLIDLSFRYVERVLLKRDDYEMNKHGAEIQAKAAIDELNYRLREGGVGYQFEGGQIIRVDSEFIHSEIVVTALKLLNSTGFEGAEQEFRESHAHYRAGSLRETVTSSGNAFESAMKSICKIKKWEYDKRARASDLLKILRAKGLFPDYLDNSFDQLLAILKSGLPEVRNNSGSHGAGPEPLKVPQHVAAYAIHLAATNIVFLVECMKANQQV
jgi:AbiJ N-terminal domain 4